MIAAPLPPGSKTPASSQLASVVTPEFDYVRQLLENTAEFIAQLPSPVKPPIDLDPLFEQITEPFSIFVCGEFNSGKSSLINALAGETLAPVGVLPTTTLITAYRSPAMAALQIVDSPGINSVITEHQRITERYVERSDFVLFVTSVERPLAQSELSFLTWVRTTWRRKLIVVINKSDLVSSVEREQIEQFVKSGCAQIMGEEPPLFSVSTKNGEGMDRLLEYLNRGLSEEDRRRAKLRAPLDTLQVYVQQVRGTLAAQIAQRKAELDIFDGIRARLKRRLNESGMLFEAFGERTQRYFAELASELETAIEEQIGFLKVLQARVSGKNTRLNHLVAGIVHEQNISRRLESLVDEAAEKVSSYRKMLFDDAKEYLEGQGAAALSESVQLLEVSPAIIDIQAISEQLRRAAEKGMTRFFAFGSAAAATGIGAKIAVAATIEVTGVVLMAVLAILSVRAFPRERRKVQKEIRSSIVALGKGFAATLDESIRGYLEHSVRLMLATFEPRIVAVRDDLHLYIERERKASEQLEKIEQFGERLF